MKIAIIADIHGNYEALKVVLEDCVRGQVQEIYSLGDNIGYGPEPEEVIAALKKHKVKSILGNHEFALINPGYLSRLNPPARESLKINLSILSQEAKEYSSGLPPVIVEHDARFVHGCPPKSTTAYLFDPELRLVTKIFTAYPEKMGFYGHTHDCGFFEYDGIEAIRKEVAMGEYILAPEKRYLINPGSVGQPRDGINNKAKYIVWDKDKGVVCFKEVAYDIKATVAKIKALGFPDFNWERLMLRYD